MTAKLLFLSKISRPDILESVPFITTTLKVPGINKYKKLGRVVKYLRGDP